jgi:hypothetical protein
VFNKLRILALCSPVVLGLAPLSIAATIHVDAAFVGVETGSLTNPFNTIQEGITAAAANDTVQVAAGTYVEQIDFLGKNIAVVGAGAETTTIRTPLGRSVVLTRTDLPTCGGNRAVDAAVWIENTTSARLSGFTVDGNNSLIYTFSGTPVRTVGIGLKAARAVIEHCRVQRVRDPSGDGNQGGLAIYVCFNGSNVSITNNTVVDCQKGGIVINGHSGNLITPACTAGDAQAPHAQITGNVVLGHGKTWAIAFNGIQVGFGATAVITNNVVSGCYYEGTSAASGGILLVGSGPCTVEGNIATANNVGIWATDVDFGFGNIAVGAGVYRGNILNNPQNGDPLSFADNAFDDNAASLWDANTYHNFDGAHGFPRWLRHRLLDHGRCRDRRRQCRSTRCARLDGPRRTVEYCDRGGSPGDGARSVQWRRQAGRGDCLRVVELGVGAVERWQRCTVGRRDHDVRHAVEGRTRDHRGQLRRRREPRPRRGLQEWQHGDTAPR